MSRAKRINKSKEKKEAKVKMLLLLDDAESVFERDKKKANFYVNKSRKLAMKYNLRFPREYKRKFCKHCYSFLKIGVNCRVRTKDGKIIYSCLECGGFMRFLLLKK